MAFTAALFLCIQTGFSQINNVDFIKAGAADGVKIMQAYMTPWANAFAAGLNGGWYTTAKPHKLGGFDIIADINIGLVPSSATTFNVQDLGLTELTGTGTSSTVSGPKTSGPTMTKTVNGFTVASFALPKGTNWKAIPAPVAQVGIGLPLGTEIKIRYIPQINIGGGNISLWGIGLMHSIMQYIPGHKLLPLDLSLFGSYTKLQGNIPVGLQPGASANYTTYDPLTAFNGQKISGAIEGWNINLIGSFNLKVLTIYGGLGYSNTKTTLAMKGNFPTPTLNTDNLPEYVDAGVLTGNDIPSVNIKNLSGLRANLGLRVKLAVVTIHADYTRALYNVFSTGIGISFR